MPAGAKSSGFDWKVRDMLKGRPGGQPLLLPVLKVALVLVLVLALALVAAAAPAPQNGLPAA